MSTRIANLPVIDLTPYRLINDAYTKDEVDTKDTNNSNGHLQEYILYHNFQV